MALLTLILMYFAHVIAACSVFFELYQVTPVYFVVVSAYSQMPVFVVCVASVLVYCSAYCAILYVVPKSILVVAVFSVVIVYYVVFVAAFSAFVAPVILAFSPPDCFELAVASVWSFVAAASSVVALASCVIVALMSLIDCGYYSSVPGHYGLAAVYVYAF